MKPTPDTAADRLDPRAYDPARAAKREAIAARLREENAAKKKAADAAAFNRRLAAEADAIDLRNRIAVYRGRARYDALLAAGHMHYDGDGRLHCFHPGSPLYDECPRCQAESAAERAAEAQANL